MGLPLTKIHHAAFDAHLIGVDPDFRIHVSDRRLEIHDDSASRGLSGTLPPFRLSQIIDVGKLLKPAPLSYCCSGGLVVP